MQMTSLPPKYARREIERRRLWAAPLPESTFDLIEDGYVAGTTLRLRRREMPNGAIEHKLTQKVKTGSGSWVTSVYLTASEFERLRPLITHAGRKRRLRIRVRGVVMAVDAWQAPCTDVTLAEVEFSNEDEAAGFSPPAECGQEVTGDLRYTGAALCNMPLPFAGAR